MPSTGRVYGPGWGSVNFFAPTAHSVPNRPLQTALIRNFCIVAHIDHGKSTLADRLLEGTRTLDRRQMREQVLDDNELERERGITIKLHAVRMQYRARDQVEYELNLIDTPGHVDFTYEVSRSLAACEGAILVVDATQGVQAQTLSNLFLALDADLEIIPVINKIDLPGAEPERRRDEVADLLGVDPDTVLLASAKEGIGIEDILEAVVARVPPPKGDEGAPLRALIFDSFYDKYQGAVPSVRVMDGVLRAGMRITFGNVPARYEVTEVGCLRLGRIPQKQLGPGEVGYLVAAIKEVAHTKVGDTVLDAENPATELLPGYQEARPMVFAGLYPTNADDYEDLRDALERLRLNDASLQYEPETSVALGFGFRCGFLGLLHMEIIQERLEREYNLGLITTAPSVVYRVHTEEETLDIDNPSQIPDGRIRIEEPYFTVSIHVPSEFVGAVIKLCQDRRGEQQGIQYASPERVIITYLMPLAEVLFDFFDKLKSATKGYASMDYELAGYRENPLVRLDMLLNNQKVDALSAVVHRDKAYYLGRALAAKLKKIVPRQQYEVIIQAAIGSKVVSRETVRALRKDVTAKCYGGDISRKRKLLEKQKEGKKRMKAVGSVEIPQDAFHAILKVDD